MCHEYGMRWWRSERSERKPTEEAKPDLMGIFAVSQESAPADRHAEKVGRDLGPRPMLPETAWILVMSQRRSEPCVMNTG